MDIRSAQIYPAVHMEYRPRAIMDIRAQLAFLQSRPQKGQSGYQVSVTRCDLVHSQLPLANLGRTLST
jgi:hypothetical protein